MVDRLDDLDDEYQELLDESEKEEMRPSFGELNLDEIFSDSFMEEHTDFEDFQEFLDPTDFSISDIEKSVLERKTNDEIDEYTSENTEFNNWLEMVEEALDGVGPGAIEL
ncbi:MAG: hypothetical protein ABEJ65_06640 [bacterium]